MGLIVERVDWADEAVRLTARCRGDRADCPSCGTSSGRVHGRYGRRVRDVALGGRQAVVELLVRRFRCGNTDCVAVTFAEQVPGLTSPHGRYTPGLEAVLAAIGLALAGRAGSRLAAKVGVMVGRDTLLRRVREVPDPPAGPVEILGVDDFALRRGRRYGTVTPPWVQPE